MARDIPPLVTGSLLLEEEKMDGKTKLKLGKIVTTPGIMKIQKESKDPLLLMKLLERHESKDWGDLDNEDKQSNDEAIDSEGRILSSYNTEDGKIWIITEWDRSVTTLLLPEEY